MSFDLVGSTYAVQTFGCQMNKHDSERIAGILESLGSINVQNVDEADIVIFMTCCVRESADTRLFGHISSMKNLPLRDDSPFSDRVIAVGGCIGQRDGSELIDAMPHVNIVFGTNNIASLPRLIEDVLAGQTHIAETVESSEDFSTSLPSMREVPFQAWLPITVGCDNFCTYCIVPYVRGRERSRSLEDIEAEAKRYVAEGVKEITLLGQNVNSYGRDIYGSPRFADVLDVLDSTGIERLRFATSHPKDLSDEVIKRFSTLRSLMPALHLPVQSGSDRILEKMNRRYTKKHYLDLIDKLRDACPDIALSTDIIVGFPGESEQDFLDTFDLVDKVGYHQVFSFQYSPRKGTPAATYDDQIPKDVVQDRFDRLLKIIETNAHDLNIREAGQTVPVLIEGLSKKNEHVLTGKSPKNQTVHIPLGEADRAAEYIGTIRDVKIEEGKTWYLLGALQDDRSE